MASLQQILLGRDWVPKDALRGALRHQKSMGGELATCLLEAGAISEERLLRALSEQYGVPYAEIEGLRETSPDVAALLSARLARRTRTVPFHTAGTALHVAMADPLDLAAQDEVAFACGKRLHVHVSHEARIAEALDRFYGEEPSSRISALIDKLNRSRYLWRSEVGDPTAETTGERMVPEEDPGPGDLWGVGASLDPPDLPDPVAELFPERSEPAAAAPRKAEGPKTPEAPARPAKTRQAPPRVISLSPKERRKLYGEGRPQTTEREAPELAGPLPAEPFDAAAQRLDLVHDREEVGAILLDLLASQFRRSMLLVVRGDRVEGWRGRGEGIDKDGLMSLSIVLDKPSVLLNLVQGSPFHLGPLAEFPAHRDLAAVWGGELPAGCLVVPVRLHDRLVLALYGDRVDEAIGGLPLHRFQDLAHRAAAAFKRCIVMKKQRASETQQS